MLTTQEKIAQWLNPLNEFNINTLCKAMQSMELSMLKELSLKAVSIGFELEFYFTNKPSESLLQMISQIPFVTSIKPELGTNQYEITTVPSYSSLKSADILYMVRHQIDTISKQNNNVAIFNATPFKEQPPSSMQANLCFYTIDSPEPLPHNHISFARILQNIMANLKNTVSIACPTKNCYYRIIDHSFVKKFKNSPTHATWGVENRTVAVRLAPVPGYNTGTRIEYRLASPLSNPYHLLLALMSSAICTANSYHPQTFTDSILASEQYILPTHTKAIDFFRKSQILKKIQYICKQNVV